MIIAVCLLFLLIVGAVAAAYLSFPSFDEHGQINECIGCGYARHQENETGYCRGCRYNPEYWKGTAYIGPSRTDLEKLRESGVLSREG